MSDETIAAVRRAYDGFAEGDLSKVFDVLDPAIEWNAEEAFAHRGIYHGHEGVARFFGTLRESWYDIRVVAEEFTDSVAGHAMVSGYIRGIERATGDPVQAPFVQVLRMRNGKVVRAQVFVDRNRAVRVMAEQTVVTPGG